MWVYPCALWDGKGALVDGVYLSMINFSISRILKLFLVYFLRVRVHFHVSVRRVNPLIDFIFRFFLLFNIYGSVDLRI